LHNAADYSGLAPSVDQKPRLRQMNTVRREIFSLFFCGFA
jgi:hypothetical protein